MTLVENGSLVMVCVTMAATPATAILDKEVVVTLSAVEGTGRHTAVNCHGVCLYSLCRNVVAIFHNVNVRWPPKMT